MTNDQTDRQTEQQPDRTPYDGLGNRRSRTTPGTRVVILDDHDLFADSLEVALRAVGHHVDRIDVTRPGTVAALVAATVRCRPRVVLLDLDLGQHNGVHLIDPLRRAGVTVVVLSGVSDPARLGECLHEGAEGAVPKTSSLANIRAVIGAVGEGRALLSPDDRDRLLAAYDAERTVVRRIRRDLEKLTWREAVVLGCLMDGMPVREIARSSHVTEYTVRSQVKAVLAKLGVSSQLAAVGAAHTVHWRPPADAQVQALRDRLA
jgi:two-component system, NarL family, nitrate/nitrite response regulator NarL